MHTVGQLILKSTAYLEQKGVETPRLDAEILLASLLRTDRLHLYMDWNKPLIDLEVTAYRERIRLRGQERMPVARILGEKEFYGRMLKLGPETFVPRPETEELVEWALELLQSEDALAGTRPVVFDVGTGTGCIILSLALEHAVGDFHASDLSEGALTVARANAAQLGIPHRVQFRLGRNLAGFGGPVNLLVSNPPYIDPLEIPGLQPEVNRHDPALALDGGFEGLAMFRLLVAEAIPVMAPGGVMVFELGETHTSEILEFLRSQPRIDRAEMRRDLAGKPRFYAAWMKM
ncbi:MAG: peptide chain release factor N(5)-glutamine methyltransferase [Candidatus Sumerlaeia bacterium]|nr:peptide chain release factor N(5)-glutamine methyltransferase [Candidatus Sumerlaeia bacterium]